MMNKEVKRWFNLIRDAADDLDDSENLVSIACVVNDAIDYYNDALVDAEKDLLKVGKLENLVIENTSFAYFYKGIQIDILQCRSYLEMLSEGYKSKKYIWYTLDEEGKQLHGKLTATEANNLVKSEAAVEILNDCIRVLSNQQHHFENAFTCFERRGLELKTIADLRNSGNHEVWIDETKETINE